MAGIFYNEVVFFIGLTVFVILGLFPPPAWATQPHICPEGLYAHLLAHIAFGAALLYMLYRSRGLPGGGDRAWLYLRLSLVFFLLWNFDAFTVHLLERHLSLNTYYYSSALEAEIPGPVNWKHLLYYVTRFDHLFCVPAMYFLWQSLREFTRGKHVFG